MMSPLEVAITHELGAGTGSWPQIMEIHGQDAVFDCFLDDNCCPEAKENACENSVWALLMAFTVDQLVLVDYLWAKKRVDQTAWIRMVGDAKYEVIRYKFKALPLDEQTRIFREVCAYEATPESGHQVAQSLLLQEFSGPLDWPEDMKQLVALVAGSSLLSDPNVDEERLTASFRFLVKHLPQAD